MRPLIATPADPVNTSTRLDCSWRGIALILFLGKEVLIQKAANTRTPFYGPISQTRAFIAIHCPILESRYSCRVYNFTSSDGIHLASEMGDLRLRGVKIRIVVHIHVWHPMYSAWLA